MNKKCRILYILDFLKNKSDEDHPQSMNDIIQYCFDHGMIVERKAVYKDIEMLKEFGYDILFTRYKKQGYFLSSTLFQSSELKVLIDAVSASTFISTKKSDQLIEKLANCTNEYNRSILHTQHTYPSNKTNNERIFYNIDTLQRAMKLNYAISFQYFDININKQKIYRKHAERYQLIPLASIWENQRYYCIGYHPKYKNFSHYRIDKMDNINIDEIPCEKPPFNLKDYTQRVFQMYGGNPENVVLKVDISLVNIVFDQFGQNILISESNDSYFIVQLTIDISPTFISWLLQFKSKIIILAPTTLINEIKEMATNLLALY